MHEGPGRSSTTTVIVMDEPKLVYAQYERFYDLETIGLLTLTFTAIVIGVSFLIWRRKTSK
ncbi:MAG: hypothetical protein ACTSVO_05550 [Candidatus Heimdallarchaeaceae archaeon]